MLELQRPPQSPRKAPRPLHNLGFLWMQPRVLCPAFLARVLVVRACFVCLSIASLDSACSILSSGGSHLNGEGGSWGWSSRLGLLGLLLPLLTNVWGLAWPMLFLNSYESHYSAFHKGVVCISCLGKVLEEISPFSSSSSCQAAMLLQGVLFVVHQDAHYVELLAGMLLAFSSCRAAAFLWPVVKGGSGGNHSSSNPAADALSITLAGEFMVISFMGCVLLYGVYCKYIGPRHAIAPSGSGSLRHTFGATHSWRSHASSAPEHQDSCSSSRVPSAGGAPPGTGATRRPGVRGRSTLQQAYLWKMATVKFCNGMFMLVYAWCHIAAAMGPQHTAGPAPSIDSSSTSGSRWGRLAYCWTTACASGPVKAALLSALVPMTHSLLAAVHADWFTQHIRWWNGVSLYLCFFARMYLVGAHMAANEQPSGIVSSAAEGAAGAAGLHALQANRTDSSGTVGEVALPPQFAFHSFVVLVTSLIVHEDSLPWFATQLVGLAVLCRQGHLLLLFHTSGLPSMQTALQRFTSLEVSMQLPEYFIITGIALVLYKWLCVGMYGRRGRGLGSTATAGQLRREVGSNSSVSMNSNLQPPSDRLVSPRRPPPLWVPSASGDGTSTTVDGLQVTTPLADPPRSPMGEGSRLGPTASSRRPSACGPHQQLQQRLLAELAPSAWAQQGKGPATEAAAAAAAAAGDADAGVAAALDVEQRSQTMTSGNGSNGFAEEGRVNHPTSIPAEHSERGSALADSSNTGAPTDTDQTPGSGRSSNRGIAGGALMTRLYAGWQLLLASSSTSHGLSQDASLTAAAQAGTESAQCSAALASHTATRNTIRVLLWLPGHVYMAVWFVWRAAFASNDLLPAARIIGAAGALLYAAAPVMHLVAVLLRPDLAIGGKDRLLPVQMVVSACLFQMEAVLLKVPEVHDARLLLLAVAAAFGLLCVSVLGTAIWLPPLVTALYVAHAWEHHAQATWVFRVASAATFLMFPPLAYAVGRLVSAAGDQVFAPLLQHLVPVCNRLSPRWGDRLAAGISHTMILLANIGLLGMLIQQLAGDPRILWDGTKLLLISTLNRLDVSAAAQASTLQTMGAVLGVGVCFAVVSALQAVILTRQAAGDQRRLWYEQHKAQVHTLAEQVIGHLTASQAEDNEPDLEEALLHTLREVAAACFPAATTSLVLLEGGILEGGMAERHLLHQGLGISRQLPRCELVKVVEVASVVQACRQGEPLFITSGSQRAGSCVVIEGYPDLEELANEHEMDAFLVVPLACAGQDQGALLVTSRAPVSLDKYSRLLAADLGHALSQTLYTLSCIGQMRAGEAIIADIMPEQAAQQLKARVFKTNKTLSTLSPASPNAAGRKSFAQARPAPMATDGSAAALPGKLEAAATTLREQQEKLLQAQNGGDPGSLPKRLRYVSCDSVPVLYKQWHPAVSVLFADISSYTAMSQQVEPEQVMLLLHQLFSKYDNLCSRFGIYKVETIGDCYMACSGLLVDNPDHARHLVEFGQAMLGVAASVPHPLGGSVRIRVGVHSGRVMSGIVGSIRARYCLFGDTVNTASRMESTGVVDRIQISEDTYQLLGELQSDFGLREAVAVKGKGVMNTYVLREDVAAVLVKEGQQHMNR